MSSGQPLSGTEYILLAEVPRAGDRWHQVHLNRAVIQDFFRITSTERIVTLEGVSSEGAIYSRTRTPFVFSAINRNPRIEFDLRAQGVYPSDGPPLLAILELGTRRFRHMLLMPGDEGYVQISKLNQELPRFGRGAKRSRTNLDAVELVWPGCPLRHARDQ